MRRCLLAAPYHAAWHRGTDGPAKCSEECSAPYTGIRSWFCNGLGAAACQLVSRILTKEFCIYIASSVDKEGLQLLTLPLCISESKTRVLIFSAFAFNFFPTHKTFTTWFVSNLNILLRYNRPNIMLVSCVQHNDLVFVYCEIITTISLSSVNIY